MIRWIPYTFVRIVIFFIAGILLSIYWPDAIPDLYLYTIFAALVITYFALFFLGNRTTVNPGLIALPAVMLAGYLTVPLHTEVRHPDHLMNGTSRVEYYQLVVTKYPQEKDRSWKLEGRVMAVQSGHWQKVKGNVLLYFSKKDFPVPFRYGDVLLIKGSPDILAPPANPGEFDYKRFLGFRNIYHQHFLRRGDVVFMHYAPPSIVMDYAIRARLWADATLKKFITTQREQAIASALVLGVTDGLDNELLDAYAATGSMHILAVSGLHISIIYLIIFWLLKPLNKKQTGKWILAIVSLFILWAYAFITGLSPSVLRAVTMFSFIAIARPLARNTNIYNTLAVSAFCLLLYDPLLIMSVGFQLSYLAVLGIVYFQPRLYALWEPNNRILDEVWKITCVSLAAQLATFALGVLYFHQFPNYFLLSNVLVIPISFAVLVGGLAVLLMSFIPVVATALGFCLALLIKLLNVIVFTIESLPLSLMEDIYITTFQCWLLVAMIVISALLVEYKQFKYVVIGCMALLMFAVLQWIHFTNDVQIKKITVYKVAGHSAVDLIDRGQAYFLTDTLLAHDPQKQRFHIRPNRLRARVSTVYDGAASHFIKPISGGKIIYWNMKAILVIDGQDCRLPDHFTPDVVVISNNALTDITVFSSMRSVSKIVVDSSNSFYYAGKLLHQAKVYNLPLHSVLHHGAFDLKLENTGT